MSLLALWFILAKSPTAPPGYPYTPVNPCSNPVKCQPRQPAVQPLVRVEREKGIATMSRK